MTKLFISQPMRGRRMADIVRERKTLVADAAVALQEGRDRGAGHPV